MRSSRTEAVAPAQRGSIGVQILVVLAATALLLLLVEGAASVLMSLRAAKQTLNMQEESHARYDDELGWRHQPGLHIADLYGPDTPFTTNQQGLRATEDYSVSVPPGRYRVVLLGDSFTMGFGVGDHNTYPAHMQTACSVLQTVNMGQGGYGLDQAYLWYRRDGAALQADLLVFAVIAQDFFRMTSDRFIGYAKPVLSAQQGRLAVRNVPVPETWQTRRLTRQATTFVSSLATFETLQWLNTKLAKTPRDVFSGHVPDEVFAAAGLAIDDLARRAEASGQRFVLVYLPTASDLLQVGPTREAAWMAEYAQRSGLSFVDLTGPFRQLPPASAAALFRPVDGHYSNDGNRFVAQALLQRLTELVPGFPACRH